MLAAHQDGHGLRDHRKHLDHAPGQQEAGNPSKDHCNCGANNARDKRTHQREDKLSQGPHANLL